MGVRARYSFCLVRSLLLFLLPAVVPVVLVVVVVMVLVVVASVFLYALLVHSTGVRVCVLCVCEGNKMT